MQKQDPSENSKGLPWLSSEGEGEALSDRGNPKWQKGMASPNPNGRPKGIVDKRTKLTQALLDDAGAVARKVIDAALGGDIQAASLILSRVAPALKAEASKVTFDFDVSAPLAQQVEYVLTAIAGGELSPEAGKQVIETISMLAGVRQIDELELRIAQLEEKRT